MDRGQSQLGGAGAIGFTPNKFSCPPIVTCSIVRGSNHVYEAQPIVVYITNVNKDSFSYTVRSCDNGQYTPWVSDKLNWIAVADGMLQ